MLWNSSADHCTQKVSKRQKWSEYYGSFVREEYVQDMVPDSDFLEDLLRVASGDERCAFMWKSFPSNPVRANLHTKRKKKSSTRKESGGLWRSAEVRENAGNSDAGLGRGNGR